MQGAVAIVIRQATLDEFEIVVQHRRSMFLDMGHPDDAAMAAMTAAFRPWITQKMSAREYLAWFALDEHGTVAAGLGLWLMDWPPHMVGGGSPQRGNIVNVYTQPEHRRKGIARALMQSAMDWCRQNGIACVILHASKEGLTLYESLGFYPTNEMRILL